MNQQRALQKHKINLIKTLREQMLAWYQQIAEQINEDKLTEEQIAIFIENAPCVQAVVDEYNRNIREQAHAREYKQTLNNKKPIAETYLKDAEQKLKILKDAKIRLERKKVSAPEKITEKLNELARLNTAIENCEKSIDGLKKIITQTNPENKEKRPRGRPPKKEQQQTKEPS